MRVLYAHQRKALRYALGESHPALFMEMRLGKSLVALRRCAMYRPRNPTGVRVLVVGPNSVLAGWEREAGLEGWKSIRLAGTREKRARAIVEAMRYDGRTVCLLNKEGWMVIPEVGRAPWDAVIADESPFLKNPKARVTKFFCKQFRGVPHRWILTGTPCPEGEHEYFCQLAFCRGGAFGFRSFWDFRQHYMEPDPYGCGAWSMKPGVADYLRRVVGQTCCVIRRRDVAMDRTKIYERRELDLPKEMREVYSTIEDKMEIGEKSTKWITTTWNWLRQLCGGFIDGQLKWRGKIDEILDLLKGELRGERVIIWCCYNAEVHVIESVLRRAGIRVLSITGLDSLAVRERRVASLSSGTQVLVVQQATAQTGMDLAAADTAIYYSTPLGLSARLQTEDRILSLQKSSPLLYIDLVTKDSVDTDAMEILKNKQIGSDLSLSRALAAAMRARKGWTQ